MQPERYKNLMEGQPGAMVDEDITESGKSYLHYTYYDKDGHLLYYADFWRSASPQDIADLLNQHAAHLLEFPPENMTLEKILDKVVELRIQARNVPGLEVNGKH